MTVVRDKGWGERPWTGINCIHRYSANYSRIAINFHWLHNFRILLLRPLSSVTMSINTLIPPFRDLPELWDISRPGKKVRRLSGNKVCVSTYEHLHHFLISPSPLSLPKPVFHTPPQRKYQNQHQMHHHGQHHMQQQQQQQACQSPQHEEIVKFVYDSKSDLTGKSILVSCFAEFFTATRNYIIELSLCFHFSLVHGGRR